VSALRSAAAAPSPAPPGESCPLCGAPLHPEQEWCLHCGAAARTRLAASPSWKGLIAALAVVVVLSLGVLAVALVKLAGGTGSTTPARTTTVRTAAAAVAPTPTTAVQGDSLSATSTSGVRLDDSTKEIEERLRRLELSPKAAAKLGLSPGAAAK
jgi:hypothetical protein